MCGCLLFVLIIVTNLNNVQFCLFGGDKVFKWCLVV